jgi:hypothetical protein
MVVKYLINDECKMTVVLTTTCVSAVGGRKRDGIAFDSTNTSDLSDRSSNLSRKEDGTAFDSPKKSPA